MGTYMIWERIKRIFKGKVNEDVIPFQTQERDKMILFKCKKCGYEEEVPDFVAFEYYTPEEFDKKNGSPIVMCIKCDSDMIIKR
jgi:ssDNA-binding Zn-finger/Zn-ribbon topoisomerase 1